MPTPTQSAGPSGPTEAGGVSQIALASDPTNGPLIGVLQNDGTALVKQGGLYATWANEASGVSQIADAGG